MNTQQENQYPLEEPAYRAWIAALPDDALVGQCSDPPSCALATYLTHEYGVPFRVQITTYMQYENGERRNGRTLLFLPDWAQEEVRFFDNLNPYAENGFVSALLYRYQYQYQ